MQAPRRSALIPAKALLVSDGEQNMAVEVHTLSSIGTKNLLHAATAGEAFVYVQKKARSQAGSQPGNQPGFQTGSQSGYRFGSAPRATPLDILVCDELLDDRSIAFFLHSMASAPETRDLPVLVVARSDASAKALAGCGLTVLTRPYSQKDFAEAVVRAMSPMRQPLSATRLEAFCRAEARKPTKNHWRSLKTIQNSLTLVEAGVQRMQAKDYKGAERIFLEVLRHDEDCVEACLNMARIARHRGDDAALTQYLVRAATECKIHRRFRHAEAIRALLPKKVLKEGIFLAEANRQMGRRNFQKAALNFQEHCKEHKNVPLYALVARAAQLTTSPAEHLARLCNAYADLGFGEISRTLSARLLSEDPKVQRNWSDMPISGQQRRDDDGRWLDSFPLLRDVVDVACYTARLWKIA